MLQKSMTYSVAKRKFYLTNKVRFAFMSKINLKGAKVQLMLNLHHSLNFCHLTGKQLLVAAKCIEGKKNMAEIKELNIHICTKETFLLLYIILIFKLVVRIKNKKIFSLIFSARC